MTSICFDDSRKPCYLLVLDSKPDSSSEWQPYAQCEPLQHVPPKVFWENLKDEVEYMIEEMQRMSVPVERLVWKVNISALTYKELYDSLPD